MPPDTAMGAGGWGLALLVLLLLGALPAVVRGGGWFEAQQLLASDGAADDEFGYSVAVSGDVAAVGAYEGNESALMAF